MKTLKHSIGDRIGKIIEVDEPGELDTMYNVVHKQLRSDIITEQRGALFVLIVFNKKPEQQSETCLTDPSLQPGWYPVEDRLAMHNASDWHAHNGVIIHCPHQAEAVIPTGVSTQSFVTKARLETGINAVNGVPPARESQLVLNEAVKKFTPDSIQPSGYSLIIPTMEVHTKLTATLNHTGTGGIVQRRTW
jgi:hypothetical protein